MSSENIDSNLQMNIPQENEGSPGKKSPKVIPISELCNKTPKSSKLSPEKISEKYKDLDEPYLEDSRIANSKNVKNESKIEGEEKKEIENNSELKKEENLENNHKEENKMEIVPVKEENSIDEKNVTIENGDYKNENEEKIKSRNHTPRKINNENSEEEINKEKSKIAEYGSEKEKIEEKTEEKNVIEENDKNEVPNGELLDKNSKNQNQDLISEDNNDNSKEDNINVINSSIFEKKIPADSKEKNSSETERNSDVDCSQEENKAICNESPFVGENGNF